MLWSSLRFKKQFLTQPQRKERNDGNQDNEENSDGFQGRDWPEDAGEKDEAWHVGQRSGRCSRMVGNLRLVVRAGQDQSFDGQDAQDVQGSRRDDDLFRARHFGQFNGQEEE